MIPLSIVIPAYAESRCLASTLAVIRSYLVAHERFDDTELIVVTADASDGTPAIAHRELAKFPLAQHIEPGRKLGKGRDVRAGMLAARGDIVVFMDADLATPIRHLDEAIAAIEAGADVAIGCRDLRHMHERWTRSVTSQLANVLARAVLLPEAHDTQCGFKAFRHAVVYELFAPLQTTGWAFDLEVLARARRNSRHIVEIAIPDWHDPKQDGGLAGETPWLARLRTLAELAGVVTRIGRQPASRSA